MPSSFPGMNPYLENPDHWPTVHNRLIVAIADILTPQLIPKYQVGIDKRVYEVAGIAEEVREPYLEVKDAETQKVITTVEVLSPTNKRGDGRKKYLEKREKILKTQTNLIEIDLLIQGEPLPLSESAVDSHYRILVSRAAQRPVADLYAFNLPESIPAFPLPLTKEDLEPAIALQPLLGEVYQKSGYDYFIDYQQDIALPLSAQEMDWIDAILKEKKIRS
ncbi:MAG: DUF4058 family protein [Cyanobacteria bacterium J06588_5]